MSDLQAERSFFLGQLVAMCRGAGMDVVQVGTAHVHVVFGGVHRVSSFRVAVDFFEDDEPLDRIRTRFADGRHGTTAPPEVVELS